MTAKTVGYTDHVRSHLSVAENLANKRVTTQCSIYNVHTYTRTNVSEGLKSLQYTCACLDHYWQTAMYMQTARAKRCIFVPSPSSCFLTGKTTNDCMCVRLCMPDCICTFTVVGC